MEFSLRISVNFPTNKKFAMLEIDSLSTLSLSYFKPFFRACKTLRGYVEEKSQDEDERIAHTEELLQLNEETLKGELVFKVGWKDSPRIYKCKYFVEVDSVDVEVRAVKFEWERDGKVNSQRFRIVTAPSNLGLSPVHYFLCPHTNKLCRKLYTDFRGFYSRWAFTHTYSKRNLSKSNRVLFGMVDAMVETDKEYRYRKERYRGKLTPFGKRMYNNYLKICAFVGRDGKIEPSARADFESTALIAPRRGRPRKL